MKRTLISPIPMDKIIATILTQFFRNNIRTNPNRNISKSAGFKLVSRVLPRHLNMAHPSTESFCVPAVPGTDLQIYGTDLRIYFPARKG